MSPPRARSKKSRTRTFVISTGACLLALIVLCSVALACLSPRLTNIVNGPGFARELDKETAKGLHLQEGKYESIQRTGTFTATSESFKGTGGIKAIKSITTNDVQAVFNPFGIFIKRWQLSSIHIKSGTIEVQTYTPKPEVKPPKPWYAFLLPSRVYLCEVTCDQADITWHFRNKESGFFGTRLFILPHGRDFDYRATGGVSRMSPAPELPLSQVHMLITKELLTLYNLDLAPSEKSSIHLEGNAGLKDDKSMHLLGTFKQVPVSPWIPTSWGDQVHGTASGQVVWDGKDQRLESSHGQGEFHFDGLRLSGIPFCDYVASATQNSALKDLTLDECSFSFTWQYPRVEVKDIDLSARHQFHLIGSLHFDGTTVQGTFELGVAPENLAWLPKARDTIFTKSHDGLLWTTVKLSGTLQDLQNDLTPRIAQALKTSPAAATGLFFRTTGEWLKQSIQGE